MTKLTPLEFKSLKVNHFYMVTWDKGTGKSCFKVLNGKNEELSYHVQCHYYAYDQEDFMKKYDRIKSYTFTQGHELYVFDNEEEMIREIIMESI